MHENSQIIALLLSIFLIYVFDTTFDDQLLFLLPKSSFGRGKLPTGKVDRVSPRSNESNRTSILAIFTICFLIHAPITEKDDSNVYAPPNKDFSVL